MIPDWRVLAHCCRCDLITKKCMTYFSWRISNKMKNGHYVQNASVIVSWFLQFKTKAWSLIKSNKLPLSIFQGLCFIKVNTTLPEKHAWHMFSDETMYFTAEKCFFRMFLCQPHVKRLVTTYHPSAHLFSLKLLWCYINGLWNSFKPEAFMSCKWNLIGLNFSVS